MADAASTLNQSGLPEAQAQNSVFERFKQLPMRLRLGLMFGLPLLIAAIFATLLYSKEADYKVLFSGIAEKDGGAIIAALQQMNVPHKLSDSSTILVPSDMVAETRLRLASQGLPKGSVVGFESMENPKLGMTQFQEQVSYQRALEGELTRSIQSISVVKEARVHLAIPKPSVFVRDQAKPSASVILNLYPGRTLEKSQIAGMMHLVSSSVPELPTKNISIVDQNGNLLSESAQVNEHLDRNQLSYVQNIEQNLAQRVVSILTPIVGENNVRAQITADVDFDQIEATSETFKPNTDIKNATIRSQQSSENNSGINANGQGIPGAASNQPLANQPPGNASAPINGNAATNPTGQANAAGAGTGAGASQRDVTTNYEVDKNVQITKRASGNVKRLSAAILVNHKSVTVKGKTTQQALTPEEVQKITDLVKQAIGFTESRGDAINVMNSPFNQVAQDKVDIPFWKTNEGFSLIKEGIKWGIVLFLSFLLIFGIIRPTIKGLSAKEKEASDEAKAAEENKLGGNLDVVENSGAAEAVPLSASQQMIEQARELAKQDPRVVASVVKTWVTGNNG